MSSKEEVLENRIANIEKCVENIQEKMDALTVTVSGQRLCPHPGLCLQLQTILTSMEKRIDTLEDQARVLSEAKSKVWGVALTLSVIIPVFTTVLVTVISKVIK